jgi:hypothetical protein
MADEADVRRIALSLPGTAQEPGNFAFLVKDKGFAWSYMERVDPNRPRVRRPDVLVVCVADQSEKQTLLAADPTKFFTTAHYEGHKSVLVRLPAVEVDELEELLVDAWRSRAPGSLVDDFDAGR